MTLVILIQADISSSVIEDLNFIFISEADYLSVWMQTIKAITPHSDISLTILFNLSERQLKIYIFSVRLTETKRS